jgi:hypothetical protein
MHDEATFSTWPGPFGHSSVADEELRQELRATLLAMRELGPGFDQAATDAFLDRVSPALAARLGSHSQLFAAREHRSPLRSAAITAAIVLGAMMIAGPFMHGSHEMGSRYRYRSFAIGNQRIVPAVPNPPQAPAAPPPLPTF